MTTTFLAPTSLPPAASPPARAASGQSSADAASSKPSSSPSTLVGNQAGTATFLQLLVAELKTQDPLNPMDSTNFVTQLAQFNSLEQLISINDSLQILVNDASQAGASPQAGGNSLAPQASAALAPKG